MAVIANLDIDQGSDFITELELENDDGSTVELLGYSVRSQFRKSYGSVIGYSFNAAITSTAAGKISLSLLGSVSSNIRAGRYLYDVEIIAADGRKTRVVEGILTINPEITRV